MNTIIDFFNEFKSLNRTAVFASGRQYTFRDLNTLFYNCLSELKQKRIKKGEVVCLFVENSISFVVLFFAIQAYGAVVLPLNLVYSEMEIEKIINLYNINHLIVSWKYKKKIDYFKKFYKASRNEEYVVFHISDFSHQDLIKKSISLLCLTSGSSGEPKAAMLTQENILVNAESVIKTMRFTDNDKFLMIKAFSYISSISELVIFLIIKCTVIIVKNIFLPKYICKKMIEHRPSFVCMVPAMALLLLELMQKENIKYDFVNKILVVGGKADSLLISNLLKCFNPYGVHIGYGLTEAASRVTTLFPEDIHKKKLSVGKAIDNVSIKILNKHGLTVKNNDCGEIVLKSKSIFAGYYNEAEGYEKKIVNGWLYTKDYGYMDSDGFIFISDKKDDIINKGGFKISCKEIEDLLQRIDGIKEAAVVPSPHNEYGEAVKAYVITDNSALDRNQIISFLKKEISPYKIPDIFQFIEQFPRNHKGEILKYKLLPFTDNKNISYKRDEP